jgi:type IV pilus assembly protein PilE
MSKFTTRDRRIRMRVLNDGFTMIEVMIVVAIVAVLAAIAIPNYSDYVTRSRIIQATSALSDLRVRYEQRFLDTRSYVGGCAQFQATVQAQTKSFTITCNVGETATTYIGTATGDPANGMSSSFVYTIDQTNAKTSAGPSGWSPNGTCWAIRKDGTCR